MSNPTVMASFTEEGASAPIRCASESDCRGNQWIVPLEPRHKILNKNPNFPDRLVCQPCYDHYRTKSSSSHGRLSQSESARSAHARSTQERITPGVLQDAAVIQRQNIDARTGKKVPKAINQLAAVPRRGFMGPPDFIPGPHVSVPNAGNSGSSGSGSLSFSSKGYSANHAQYGAARASWAQNAYVGVAPEVISILISVRYEAPGKPKGESFGAISEGVMIDAKSTPRSIMQTVYDQVYPKLKARIDQDTDCRFEFKTTNFTVRDVATWISLAGQPLEQPYYYASCLKPGRTKLERERHLLVFVRPAPIGIALVIDHEEWMRLQEFMDQMHISQDVEDEEFREQPVKKAPKKPAKRPIGTASKVSSSDAHPGASSNTQSSTLDALETNRRITRSASKLAATPSLNQSRQSEEPSLQFPAADAPSLITFTSGTLRSGLESSSSVVGVLSGASWSLSKKERPITPPNPTVCKRSAAKYRSPDQRIVKKALTVGGSLKKAGNTPLHTTEQIEFFRIKSVPFHELIEQPDFFSCKLDAVEYGTLSMVASDLPLGIGSFKSAHNARLNLHVLSSGNILGCVPNQHVAAKRMFESWSEDQTRLERYKPSQEYLQTIREANIMLWAVSLFDFCYSFIQSFIEKNGPPPADLTIFDIRFVEAGVALVHDSSARGHSVKDTSSLVRSFIIEEIITPTETDQAETFLKFVHNNLAAPTPFIVRNTVNYAVAEFLCFTQHIQYEKSGGTVFLSDLQGKSSHVFGPCSCVDLFTRFTYTTE
ncbi:unnamed protein product [Mycena citricolor]|uniref:Alpha-type protein kinase domain-containing protein n=1 Tax=Mycena citricolor TaxID=2018698 RepID=A0AAD2H4X6_9AGAR|nr:unnamed protein product [Mycena citricolor]